jgi:hypothetical protein
MPRITIRPAETVREAIRKIDEVPATATQPGFVRVLVGLIDEAGEFIVPQQFSAHVIEGQNYADLVGPPAAWAPDKPAGTYRNDDLWHCIDVAKAQAKERVAKAKEAQAQKEAALKAKAEQDRKDAEAAAAALALLQQGEAVIPRPAPAEGQAGGGAHG